MNAPVKVLRKAKLAAARWRQLPRILELAFFRRRKACDGDGAGGASGAGGSEQVTTHHIVDVDDVLELFTREMLVRAGPWPQAMATS